MKSRRWIISAVIVSLVCGAAVLTESLAQPAAKTPKGGTRVAVCDLVRVFDNYQRAKDLGEKLKGKREQLRVEDKKRDQAIKEVQTDLSALKPGREEYEKRFADVQRMTIERKNWLQFEEQVTMREHYRLTKEMYEEILAAIAQIAKERSIQLVLFRDPPQLQGRNSRELLAQIGQRKVLYGAPDVDLTDAVLGRINTAYRRTHK